MKKLILILMVGSLFSQESSPCDDETYLELKKKKLDEMSDREYEYFTRKDKECADYNKNNNIKKVIPSISDKNTYQPKFNRYAGLMFAEDIFASSIYFRIENNWGAMYMMANYEIEDYEDIYNTSINGLMISYDFNNNSKIFTPHIILGFAHIKLRWEDTIWDASDTITWISPLIGGGVYIHIGKHISLGITPLLGQSALYTMYSDGTTKINDKELQLYPVFSAGINF